MDIQTAKRFQTHAEEAIKELSSALLLARDMGSEEEFLAVSKLMGEIIARIDGLLHESIYGDHPEMPGTATITCRTRSGNLNRSAQPESQPQRPESA